MYTVQVQGLFSSPEVLDFYKSSSAWLFSVRFLSQLSLHRTHGPSRHLHQRTWSCSRETKSIICTCIICVCVCKHSVDTKITACIQNYNIYYKYLKRHFQPFFDSGFLNVYNFVLRTKHDIWGHHLETTNLFIEKINNRFINTALTEHQNIFSQILYLELHKEKATKKTYSPKKEKYFQNAKTTNNMRRKKPTTFCCYVFFSYKKKKKTVRNQSIQSAVFLWLNALKSMLTK